MNHIKNIIFDLGGVIIDIEPELTLKAFNEHVDPLPEISIYSHQMFRDFETGKVDAKTFRKEIKEIYNLNIPDTVIDQLMNTMLGEIPKERIELIDRLKANYRTFLLSNTNPIHFEAVSQYMLEEHQADSFDPFFHETYYSHLIGMRKPDAEVFSFVLHENDLNPEETLFLDDTGENLKSARTLGIQTVKVTRENDILEILRAF